MFSLNYNFIVMRYLFLLLIFFSTALNSFALDVVYPKKDKVTINCQTTFFVGSADVKVPLTINGVKVPVHKSGGFAYFVKLQPGENVFTLKSNGETLVYKVHSSWKPPVKSKVKKSAPSVKVFPTPKLVYTADDKTPIRTTPVSAGVNRIVHLQKGVPLYIDGELGKFYRVTLSSNEKYWVAKNHVKSDPEAKGGSKSVIISKDFKDTTDSMIYTFNLSNKIPYILTENSDDDFKNGLGLNFYNMVAKPDMAYELYFPLQHQLFGYSAEFKDEQFILTIRKLPQILPDAPLKNIKITVDAGHGGNEKGAIGCLGDFEKDITLDVALKLQKELRRLGAIVVMTRETDEKVSLKRRVEITNESDSSIFVSIHGNALPDNLNPLEHRGTSVYYYYPQAENLARSILNSMNTQAHTKNDGVRRGSLAVVRNTNALSVLVELGYLINPEDNALLVDEKFREKCANAIALGISDYLKSLVQ